MAIMVTSSFAGAFPTTFDRFHLAYGESVSAVDYIVSTHDRDRSVPAHSTSSMVLPDGNAQMQRATGTWNR